MLSDRPSIAEGLDVNEVDDGFVVYEPERDKVKHLNGSAAIVFTLCDGSHSAAEIAGLIAEAFGLEEPPLADVAACIAQLRDEGLLRIAESGA